MRLKRFVWILLFGAGLMALASCGGDSSGPSGDDPTGSGTVVLNPEPNSIDAPWTLNGPGTAVRTGNGDETLSDLPAGSYRVTWGDVAGWTAPGQETQALADGQTLTFTGNYFEGQVDPGSVTVDPNPDQLNAPWTLTYPGRFIYTGFGDSTMTDLPAGPYRITWGEVPGWATPPEVVETMEEGAALVVSATYVQLAQIHVDPEPDGIEESWTLDGPGGYQATGSGDETLIDLEPGSYTVTWGPAVDYTTPGDQTLTLSEGGSLTFSVTYQEIGWPTGFILVDDGTFTMGAPITELGTVSGERPQHDVTLSNSFQLQKTEVTNKQYMEAVQWAYDHGHVTATANGVVDNMGSDEELLRMNLSYCDIDFSDGVFTCRAPGHPVRAVTWYGAASYCDWLSLQASMTPAYDHGTWQCNGHNPYTAQGYRLPTEAEWEYACRAGSSTAFANGEITNTQCDDPVLELIGWYCGNSDNETHTVGQLITNAWGFYDMHGNCFEWCNDQYEENWYIDPGANLDPVGPYEAIQPTTFYVIRGGGAFNGAAAHRSASRNGTYPASVFDTWGFRVARTNN